MLSVRDLHVQYRRPGRRSTPVDAVRGVSLDVPRGRSIGLVGESGSGKSTIGSAILGLTPVTSGTVTYAGTDITHASRSERRLHARRMQAVFQDPFGSMNPAVTVGDTVTEALRHNLKLGKQEIEERLLRALDDVGMPASCAERYPAQFSGGQRQRLAIARALVMNPEFIVCDEPTSALDLSIQAQILNVLLDLRERRGLSYLFISHDLTVVRHLCDEMVVLYAGAVVERGPAHVVAESPAHPYTRALLASAPVPDPDQQRARRELRLEAGNAGSGAPRPDHGCRFAHRCPFAVDRCATAEPTLAPVGDSAAACFLAEDIRERGLLA
nr:ABC transporter ATP-binding protein [Demequina sp. NBRC 110051]